MSECVISIALNENRHEDVDTTSASKDKLEKEHQINSSTNESSVPLMVNSSFDSTENKIPLSVRDTEISKSELSSTTDCFRIDSAFSNNVTQNVSNIRRMLSARLEATSFGNEARSDEGNIDDLVAEEVTKNIDEGNQQENATNHPDNQPIIHTNELTGIDVDDGLQGFLMVDETSLICNIETLYTVVDDDGVVNNSATTKELYRNRNDLPMTPHDKNPSTDEDLSESQTLDFYSCRDEATVSDNLSSSEVSFHTALSNTIHTASISGSNNNNDAASERLEGFSDFLTCRSGEEPSSHLYDLSSSQVDDQLSDRDSGSIRTYRSCREFNQQGLVSILKRKDADILLKEGIESPINKSICKTSQRAVTRRRKFLCCVGSVILVVIPLTMGMLLTTRQKDGYNIVDNNRSEISPTRNDTVGVPPDVPTTFPSCVPSLAPVAAPKTFVAFVYPSDAPSDAPSIHPTTSRHRDNAFLRPPKKSMPPKGKANTNPVGVVGNGLI